MCVWVWMCSCVCKIQLQDRTRSHTQGRPRQQRGGHDLAAGPETEYSRRHTHPRQPQARVPACQTDTTQTTLDLTTPPCTPLEAGRKQTTLPDELPSFIFFGIITLVILRLSLFQWLPGFDGTYPALSCKLLGLVRMIFPKPKPRQAYITALVNKCELRHACVTRINNTKYTGQSTN